MVYEWNEHSMWAYSAVFKQTAGGGGAIKVQLTPSERTLLLYGFIGPNDYAANRTVLFKTETDGVTVGNFLFRDDVDNVILPFPSSDHSVLAHADGPNLRPLVLGAGDVMFFQAGTLVTNEEFTIVVRCLIDGNRPVVTTTGSGGTVTVVTNYNKVI